MSDYLASRVAREEYEQRIRSIVPVYEHDVWLRDDRRLSVWPIQSGIAGTSPQRLAWVTRRVGRLFQALGGGLTTTGEWIKQAGVSFETPLREQEKRHS
jgi:hypothetical protein